jgi:AcrR family transcriptional regulator
MGRELTDESGAQGGRRERKAAERRRRILREAAAVFRERGFSCASADEIAERLDMAKGTLFYHFGSKHGLLVACHEESLGKMTDCVRTAAGTGATPDEALRSAVEGLALLALDDLDGAAMHTDPRVLPAEARARLEELRGGLEREIQSLLEPGVTSGAFRPLDTQLDAALVVATLVGLAKRARPDRSPEDAARALADLVLDGVRARGARVSPQQRQRGRSSDPEEWLRR